MELVLGRDDGVSRVVGRISPGGHFGETGILIGKPRSLSVRALCDLVIICFDKRYCRIAFLSNTRIHKQLDAALAERLRVAFVDQVDKNRQKDSGDN
ncbi:MAG: cyclic nucleotide-binding domain-containing protein [Desulfobulbaceae bacterium]|nr:cyclic nucleotide-binding domain-containing protein [Desulfobulbaceae bacterium]